MSGRSVVVREQADVIGGGTRTEELTLPGFLHDVCSTVHPLGVSSPFFRALPLAEAAEVLRNRTHETDVGHRLTGSHVDEGAGIVAALVDLDELAEVAVCEALVDDALCVDARSR